MKCRGESKQAQTAAFTKIEGLPYIDGGGSFDARACSTRRRISQQPQGGRGIVLRNEVTLKTRKDIEVVRKTHRHRYTPIFVRKDQVVLKATRARFNNLTTG